MIMELTQGFWGAVAVVILVVAGCLTFLLPRAEQHRVLKGFLYTFAFLAVLFALAPSTARSVIDGDEETWIHTVIGWEYRVPLDHASAIGDWFPALVPLVAASILCLLLVLLPRWVRHRAVARGGSEI